MTTQKTLAREITIEGKGVHSGETARMQLKPAPVDHGIVFVRSDLPGQPEIPARYDHVISTQLATSLGKGSAKVSTVEHVLAAVQGHEIDNLRIEIDGPEIPIMDGSSAVFSEAFENVGMQAQLKSKRYLKILEKIELKVGEKWATVSPFDGFEVFGSIDWDHPSIGYQEYHYIEGQTSFEQIAPARTFGFLDEVEQLRKMGLARGGSLENAVVLDHALVLNPEGLRFPDEFVRHKVLDALGDFRLAGMSIQGYFRLHRAGHELHRQLLEAIFAKPSHFEIVEATKSKKTKSKIVSIPQAFVAGIS